MSLVLAEGNADVSPCCKAGIYTRTLGGVEIGSCMQCDEFVIRRNPRTGKLEWLDGELPWSELDATAKGPRMRRRNLPPPTYPLPGEGAGRRHTFRRELPRRCHACDCRMDECTGECGCIVCYERVAGKGRYHSISNH